MKKIILMAVIIITALVTLSSLTYTEASSMRRGHIDITLTVPIKPKMTVIIEHKQVYGYLKKGYQIQNAWSNSGTHQNMFVLVKY
jgi:hypothetical protein